MLDEELKNIEETAKKRHFKINDYFMIKEAAAYIGVTENTLRNWERNGKIIAIRNPHNKYRLYKREHLDKFLSSIEIQDL